jgi:hypothetical protein
MANKKKLNKGSRFWQRVAKTELKLYEELEKEFRRHEEALRRIILKFSVTRP